MGRALYEKYKKKFILFGVESIAFQRVLADEFSKMGLPIIKLYPDQDKYRRAVSVSHFFHQGRVRINTPKLRDQLLRFRGVDGDKDDLVDAAVHCLRLIKDNSAPEYQQKENRYKELDPRSESFWRRHFNDMPNRNDSARDVTAILG